MSIKGRFGIDVQFTDSTTGSGVQSLKALSLQHATEYDFGKVAIVTGTVGTSVATVSVSPTTYRDSAGSIVSFASVSRVAFSADGPTAVKLDGTGDWTLFSRSNQIAVSEATETASFSINVTGTVGTAAYTLLLYGS